MKVKFEGMSTSEQYLTVHATIETPAYMQFCSVQIPWHRLLEQHVTDGMDRAVRRKLIHAWSEVDLADPLF